MLALGIISAGFAFHAWLNVTHGSQESARFAATLSIEAGGGDTTAWLTEVSDRALAAANLSDSATTAVPGSEACVAVVSPINIPSLNSHMTVTTDADGNVSHSAALIGPCPNMPTMSGDYVQTYVAKPVDFNYVFGSTSLTVASKSVNRFEAVSLS